jgi:hypothetical protein
MTVEPLSPEMRAALKRAHPGLTDAEIDRYEELLFERMQCDPQTEAGRIAEIDRKRVVLLQKRMPLYNDVVRQVKAETPSRKPKSSPSVTVK